MDYRLAFAFCFLILEFRSVTNLSVPSICLEVITDKPMLKYLCGKFLSSLLAVENQNEPGAPSHSDPGAPSHSEPGMFKHYLSSKPLFFPLWFYAADIIFNDILLNY
nr:uncharacterized protein LOC122272244 isoform X2 [Parasteatoda tepidariorum]